MNWPHAPAHWIFEPGLYMVTAGTYRKLSHLSSPERLDFFQQALFLYATEFGWDLRAWAVLANHYHFVAASPSDPTNLPKFIGKLHGQSAKQVNRWDKTHGRKIWFQFWDTHITFERSYLARLKYVYLTQRSTALFRSRKITDGVPPLGLQKQRLLRSSTQSTLSKSTSVTYPTISDLECADMSALSKAATCTPKIISVDAAKLVR